MIVRLSFLLSRRIIFETYLIKVDHRLPELVLQLVEVAHTDFTEVTRMVLVDVGAVVVLTTGHTTTTGMLPVLADTSVTSRDVAAAVSEMLVYCAEIHARCRQLMAERVGRRRM